MKLFLFLIFLSFKVFSSALMDCPSHQIRVWMPQLGYTCVTRMQVQQNPYEIQGCFGPTNYNPNWFNNFPSAIYQPQAQPWWVTQGNFITQISIILVPGIIQE